MNTKLVRTQILLDPVVLSKVKLKLKNRKVSLAYYIRQLLEENLNLQTENIENKYQKLLSSQGFFSSSDNGLEALNYNDIYKI